MKKLTLVMSILLIAALLSACGGNAANTANTGTSNTAGDTASTGSDTTGTATGDNGPNNFGNMELPMMSQLVIGTFELEGTDNAVDSAQAAELLPLWQVLNNLLNSDTTAQEEIDAVVSQIESTMTDEQLQAIADMDLNNQSIMALMQQLGLDMARPDTGNDNNGTAQTPGDFQGGGDFPGGGPGPGAGNGDGTGMTQEQMQAIQATREAGGGGFRGGMGGGNQFTTLLIGSLIDLLEGKIS